MRPRLLAGFVLVAIAVLSVCRIVEHDTPWYVAAGDLILRTHGLPAADPFSYTSTRAWLNHEWLAEVLLALGHRAGGFAALSVLEGIAVAATIGVVWRARAGAALLPWALLVFVVREAASPRAQLFSTFLFAATLALVLDDDAAAPRARRLWWCVPLQLVWTQLHGGNPTGVALVGLLFLSGPSLRRALVAAACALATIVGPYGVHVHGHFLGAHAALPMIREWEPMWHALRAGALPVWCAVALLLGAVVAVTLRPGTRERLILGVFTIVAVRYVRFSVEASIVAAAVLARALAAWEPPALRRAGPALAAAVIAASLGVSARSLGLGLDTTRFPIGATAWLRAHRPPGPMLNSYNYGGYLLWAWPEQRVFVDGRAFTVYDEEIVAALPLLYADLGRYAALEAKFGFRLAVLQRAGRGEGLAAMLRARPDWHVAYEDAISVVLVRR